MPYAGGQGSRAAYLASNKLHVKCNISIIRIELQDIDARCHMDVFLCTSPPLSRTFKVAL